MEAATEENQDAKVMVKTAYLVDLVSNHKIKIPSPACKIGRDESNDIVISGDQAISRHHLVISTESEHFFVEDFNSRHGTFLNGNPIKTRQAISDGDVIKIGVSLFWFVVESSVASEQMSGQELSSSSGAESGSNMPIENGAPAQPTHVNVKSEFFLEQTDPSAATANEIPVMANEDSLLERIRSKARSFDHSDLFVKSQLQPGTFKSSPGSDPDAPGRQTQQLVPALDTLLASTKVLNPKVTEGKSLPDKADQSPSPQGDRLINACLQELEAKYGQLEEEIKQAEKTKQEITEQIEVIKLLVSGLIEGTESKLLTACSKVLSGLGWQCSVSEQDKQELQLRAGNECLLARIILIANTADRSHLGQLLIAQTRFWCEQGLEPKGILIVGCVKRMAIPVKIRLSPALTIRIKN